MNARYPSAPARMPGRPAAPPPAWRGRKAPRRSRPQWDEREVQCVRPFSVAICSALALQLTQIVLVCRCSGRRASRDTVGGPRHGARGLEGGCSRRTAAAKACWKQNLVAVTCHVSVQSSFRGGWVQCTHA